MAEFLVVIQHGEDEDLRDNIIATTDSADNAEQEALGYGDDVRVIAVYERIR